MIISAIGDSLTEGDYGVFGKSGIANLQKENYPYFLSLLTKDEVRNFGNCGFTASAYLERYLTGRWQVAGSDIIIVMLGTNGGFDPDGDTQCNRDYATLLQLLQKDAPGARIYLCTPPHVTENPYYSNCGFADRVATAVAFVRKFAKENNYPLIDVAACGLFTAENEHIMQANDGLHFTAEGYRTLAAYLYEQICN